MDSSVKATFLSPGIGRRKSSWLLTQLGHLGIVLHQVINLDCTLDVDKLNEKSGIRVRWCHRLGLHLWWYVEYTFYMPS